MGVEFKARNRYGNTGVTVMNSSKINAAGTWRTIFRVTAVLAVLGAASYAMERWGGGHMTRLSAFAAAQGNMAGVVFAALNALGTMLLLPQALFTVAAGALFGWKLGAMWASLGMTVGALGAFLVARYGGRDFVRARFEHHSVYGRMRDLSLTHPLHVISLSRLIPVVPFPVASYLLGMTEVRILPYAVLTWVCMVPETLFLASGGHLLNAGITRGRTSEEAAAVLLLAGIVLAVLVHRMKGRLLGKTGSEAQGGPTDGGDAKGLDGEGKG
jgi:uncharacterized membrane protein YdjX (TVP38/TMEM64 family)